MLTDADLLEVWCEGLDDVTLVWRDGTEELFEFVQVKKLELNQLWTPALLVRPDGKIPRNEDEDEDEAEVGETRVGGTEGVEDWMGKLLS